MQVLALLAALVVLFLTFQSYLQGKTYGQRTALQCCGALIGIDLMWILLRTLQTLPR